MPSGTGATARGPQPGIVPPRDLDEARDTLASTVASRRKQRTALWQDSSLFQDSFFAPDSRQDSLGNGEFASLTHAYSRQAPRESNGHDAADTDAAARNGVPSTRLGRGRDDDEPAGVVVDEPAAFGSHSRH